MSVPVPHFLLFSHASRQRHAHGPVTRRGEAEQVGASQSGHWRFEIRSADGHTTLEAADREECDSAERLELMAIVRGLEALDQPSRVTLVTASRGIRSGLKYGLPQWRENDWQWERYGQLSPVKNSDLWRRIDRALAIHDVRCREGALDAADDLAQPLVVATPPRQRLNAQGKTLRFDAPQAAGRRFPQRSREPQGWKRLLRLASAVFARILGRNGEFGACDTSLLT
jgi:ribonuclease HI